MRVVKDAKERRNEILDAAEELFGTKGFDNTSTNDILERVGIARGTLYYHFKSKEEILDAMIHRMTEQLMAKAAQIAGQPELPVLERLTGAVMALNVDSGIGHEVMQQVHKPQNALMHQKMQEELLTGIMPILTELLEEGSRQGICRTDYPAEAIEMTMLYANTMFDAQIEQTPERKQRRIEAFLHHTELLLGAKEGALREAIMKIFEGEPM